MDEEKGSLHQSPTGQLRGVLCLDWAHVSLRFPCCSPVLRPHGLHTSVYISDHVAGPTHVPAHGGICREKLEDNLSELADLCLAAIKLLKLGS